MTLSNVNRNGKNPRENLSMSMARRKRCWAGVSTRTSSSGWAAQLPRGVTGIIEPLVTRNDCRWIHGLFESTLSVRSLWKCWPMNGKITRKNVTKYKELNEYQWKWLISLWYEDTENLMVLLVVVASTAVLLLNQMLHPLVYSYLSLEGLYHRAQYWQCNTPSEHYPNVGVKTR